MTNKYEIDRAVSHIEIASLNYDQWTLSVGLREYEKNQVSGMTHLLFTSVQGFRLLDEGDMLNHSQNSGRLYVVETEKGGWLEQEISFGNVIVEKGYREFLISTGNECVCVIAHDPPVLVKGSVET